MDTIRVTRADEGEYWLVVTDVTTIKALLYHVALIYPDRRGLGRAVRLILDRAYPIDGAEDHGATVSVYLRDPDANSIELYYDRPRSEWFDPQGNPILKAEAFDPRELLEA